MFEPQVYNDSNHGFIYLDDGSLYGFGSNSYGLGIPQNGKSFDLKYEYVMCRPDIVKIVCHEDKSFLLLDDGTLMSTENGKWVDEDKDKDVIDVAWDGRNIYIVRKDGNVWTRPSGYDGFLLTGDENNLRMLDLLLRFDHRQFIKILGLNNIKKVYAGSGYSLFQDYADKLYILGSGTSGRLDAFIKDNIELPIIRNKFKENLNSKYLEIKNLEKYIDTYVFPICIGTKPHFKGLFSIENLIFIWTHNKIELVSGLDNVSFNRPKIVYESTDILYVLANKVYAIIVLDNGEIWKMKPTPRGIQEGKCKWNLDKGLYEIWSQYENQMKGLKSTDILWDFPTTLISKEMDIVGVFLGEKYCLMNHEYVFEDSSVQEVDIVDDAKDIAAIFKETCDSSAEFVEKERKDWNKQNFLHKFLNVMMAQSTTLMSTIDTDQAERLEKLQTIFPQIYDDARIKIFGAGTLISTFEPKYYKFMPYVNRRKVVYGLWIFKMLGVKIPKYVRYEILKYVF